MIYASMHVLYTAIYYAGCDTCVFTILLLPPVKQRYNIKGWTVYESSLQSANCNEL